MSRTGWLVTFYEGSDVLRTIEVRKEKKQYDAIDYAKRELFGASFPADTVFEACPIKRGDRDE